MAWSRYTHASVSAQNPQALGACDRCGMVYQHSHLSWQYDWRGPRLQNLRILVCPTCLDQPQQNGQRTIIIPPDPVPIINPRPDPHMFMGQSSSPDPYQNGSPNTIATEDGNPIVLEGIAFLTSADQSPWVVTAGIIQINRIEVIAAGGGGSGGGIFQLAGNTGIYGGAGAGAGGYSRKSAITFAPGDAFNFSVGIGGLGGAAHSPGTDGGNTWFGGTDFSDALVSAGGGIAGFAGFGPPGIGGAGGAGITGDLLYAGGSGAGGGGLISIRASGGGGAAGSNGNGLNGTLGGSGGPSTTGGGGMGDAGFGGSGGTGGTTPNGGSGAEFDSSHGSGGGGGGGDGIGVAGGLGGSYGAGGGGGNSSLILGNVGVGGNGGDGLIIIRFSLPSPLITEIGITPTPTSSGYT